MAHTGLFRIVGLLLGDPKFLGPGGASWPDVPWWELSGLFDLTGNQSPRARAADLEAAMAAHGNDNLVINGYSQGAGGVNVVKRRLAEQYPDGSDRTSAKPLISDLVGGFMGLSARTDLDNADVLMLIGVDPVVSHGIPSQCRTRPARRVPSPSAVKCG